MSVQATYFDDEEPETDEIAFEYLHDPIGCKYCGDDKHAVTDCPVVPASHFLSDAPSKNKRLPSFPNN